MDAGGYAPSKACSLYGTGEYKLSFGEGIRYGGYPLWESQPAIDTGISSTAVDCIINSVSGCFCLYSSRTWY